MLIMLLNMLSISLSGLTAQKQIIESVASNIANSRNTAAVPENAESAKLYQPYDVNQISNPNGGVKTQATLRETGYIQAYDPNSIYANKDGQIIVPNISLEEELIQLQIASASYKANVAVIKTLNEITDEVFEIFV